MKKVKNCSMPKISVYPWKYLSMCWTSLPHILFSPQWMHDTDADLPFLLFVVHGALFKVHKRHMWFIEWKLLHCFLSLCFVLFCVLCHIWVVLGLPERIHKYFIYYWRNFTTPWVIEQLLFFCNYCFDWHTLWIKVIIKKNYFSLYFK